MSRLPAFDPAGFVRLAPREQERVVAIVRHACPALSARLAVELSEKLYFPISLWWFEGRGQQRDDLPFIGSVSGLPGTGKSTLAAAARGLLVEFFQVSVATVSLDDLYLTRSERMALAERIHPLLATRGVPGTHDVEWGLRLIEGLSRARPGDVTRIPRFDKLADDRFAERDWRSVRGRPQVLIVEGWCWGAVPAAPHELNVPINERERDEDASGTWRRYVHDQLAGRYRDLFDVSRCNVHLAAPSHQASVRFRLRQGREDRKAKGRDPEEVTEENVAYFLSLFERVGRLERRRVPEVLVQLDHDGSVVGADVEQPTRAVDF